MTLRGPAEVDCSGFVTVVSVTSDLIRVSGVGPALGCSSLWLHGQAQGHLGDWEGAGKPSPRSSSLSVVCLWRVCEIGCPLSSLLRCIPFASGCLLLEHTHGVGPWAQGVSSGVGTVTGAANLRMHLPQGRGARGLWNSEPFFLSALESILASLCFLLSCTLSFSFCSGPFQQILRATLR